MARRHHHSGQKRTEQGMNSHHVRRQRGGKHKRDHAGHHAFYAPCTGFMALGMMIPGLWSGWLVNHIGYRHFFLWVIGSAFPGLILALCLKIAPR